MSLPEVLLWKQLRRGALEALRFRRQHPVGPYILDFYCDEARRDAWLRTQGIRVLRFAAVDLLKHLNEVVLTISASSRP